jgi:hypothetical protein
MRFNVLFAGDVSVTGGAIRILPFPVVRTQIFRPIVEGETVDQYRGWGLFGNVADSDDTELLERIGEFQRTALQPPAATQR